MPGWTPILIFKLDETLFLLYYPSIFNIKRKLIMGIIEYVLKTAADAAPEHPGFQTQPMYIILNLAIPIILGILLASVTKLIEKGLTRLLGDRR
jgi:hypothetical protein